MWRSVRACGLGWLTIFQKAESIRTRTAVLIITELARQRGLGGSKLWWCRVFVLYTSLKSLCAIGVFSFCMLAKHRIATLESGWNVCRPNIFVQWNVDGFTLLPCMTPLLFHLLHFSVFGDLIPQTLPRTSGNICPQSQIELLYSSFLGSPDNLDFNTLTFEACEIIF